MNSHLESKKHLLRAGEATDENPTGESQVSQVKDVDMDRDQTTLPTSPTKIAMKNGAQAAPSNEEDWEDESEGNYQLYRQLSTNLRYTFTVVIDKFTLFQTRDTVLYSLLFTLISHDYNKKFQMRISKYLLTILLSAFSAQRRAPV